MHRMDSSRLELARYRSSLIDSKDIRSAQDWPRSDDASGGLVNPRRHFPGTYPGVHISEPFGEVRPIAGQIIGLLADELEHVETQLFGNRIGGCAQGVFAQTLGMHEILRQFREKRPHRGPDRNTAGAGRGVQENRFRAKRARRVRLGVASRIDYIEGVEAGLSPDPLSLDYDEDPDAELPTRPGLFHVQSEA